MIGSEQRIAGGYPHTGDLYGFAKVPENHIQDDHWFHLDLIASGNHILVKLDGKLVVDYVDARNSFVRGPIGLQKLGVPTRVSYRNIRVRELSNARSSDNGVSAVPGGGMPSPSNINTPAFQQWMKDVAALPADKQVEAVAQKLQQLNPGFDGKLTGWDGKGTPRIVNGVVTELWFYTDNVTDISPVRALAGLKSLYCPGSHSGAGKLMDLSAMQGMPLTALACNATRVSDLSPLRGMPLTDLNCGSSGVSDLSPLERMALTSLACYNSQVSSLSPLRGMELTFLSFNATQVSDLTPLQGMNLTEVRLTPKNITKGLDVIRQMKSLVAICVGNDAKLPADAFWKKYDAGEFGKASTTLSDPAFQKWMKEVAAMRAEQQVEAVAKKLQQLNPGFDGKVTGSDPNSPPTVENGVVTEFGFLTDSVTDISPVRALAGLKNLSCIGSSQGKGVLSDLTPLLGMRLTRLNCGSSQVADLSPLKGMPLTWLGCGGTKITSLTPLLGMPLTQLHCPSTPVSDLSPLQGMRLTKLNLDDTKVSDLSPLQGMPLMTVWCDATRVSDLSPLKGAPLDDLRFRDTPVSDLSPLDGAPLRWCISFTPKNINRGIDVVRKMTSLQSIEVSVWNFLSPAEFWKKYDAGEFKPITTFNDPAFQQWLKDVAAMPAEKQVEAVAKKLVELNPRFDGTVKAADGNGPPKIDNGIVTELWFVTDHVTDISPVRALAGLRNLCCTGSREGKGILSDLSPLQGMRLTRLNCGWSPPISDLSPLRGMPLATLYFDLTHVSDLSPLQEMHLKNLSCAGTQVSDLSPLRAMQLTYLGCEHTQVSDLSPLHGMPLAHLDCFSTPVSDLSPLKGMPLTDLTLSDMKISDLSPLHAMRLTALRCHGTQVSVLSPLEGMPLTGLDCSNTPVSELSPLHGMPLTYLDCNDTRVSDLSPLHGMPLTHLECLDTPVSDLSSLHEMPLATLYCDFTAVADLAPLHGMPLTQLQFGATRVSDLSPLQGMRLTKLHCGRNPVSDLSPLKGMPLSELFCEATPVSDLSPLAGMNLTTFGFTPRRITRGLDIIRQMKSLQTILPGFYKQFPTAEFWQRFDAGEFKPITTFKDPAFVQWTKDVAALPAEQQVEAVAKKLQQLNPGFDGHVFGWELGRDSRATPKIDNGVVTEFGFFSDNVTDVSPVRAGRIEGSDLSGQRQKQRCFCPTFRRCKGCA